jgi:5'-3' exonuclease
MRLHLLDGTYELFRHFHALPSEKLTSGQEIAATHGVVSSVLGMFESGVTHLAVATDHVIESFRNTLWPGYKDGSGIDPDLFSQFAILEDVLTAMGVVVWPMIEFEADDGLAAGAALGKSDTRVTQTLICTPDKDLAQCVEGSTVVQLDRRQRQIIDEDGVKKKFGVEPESIPDYLALVGDSADGFPGLPRWGAKSSSVVLARYGHLEHIPPLARNWQVDVRGADTLASVLQHQMEDALLFRTLATLRIDAPISKTVDELEWRGPDSSFGAICDKHGRPDLMQRALRVKI